MEIKLPNLPYFTRSNLRLVLGENRRTLDGRIRSLVKKGSLLMIKKGFYLNLSFYNQSQNKQEILEKLGEVMVFPSLLSGEYILSKSGFLAESVNAFTYVTTKKTQKIISPIGTFIYRSIKDDLFLGKTSLAKSLFDMIYFTTKGVDDLKTYLTDSRFNWDVLNEKDMGEFKQLVETSNVAKMKKVLKIVNNARSTN